MEQGPADVLAKLKRKEITLFRAAEILNVSVTTLANYLSTLRHGENSLTVTNTTEQLSTFRVDVSDESDKDVSDEEENEIFNNTQTQQTTITDITFVSKSGTVSKMNNLNGN